MTCAGNRAVTPCSILVTMGRVRHLLNVTLALSLIFTGWDTAPAAMPANDLHSHAVNAVEQAPACHGEQSSPAEPSGTSLPDCCQADGCVCGIAAAFVAAIGAIAPGSQAPEHGDSLAAIVQGHSFPAPNLLLRPPNT
jgi:hypothetical protein